MGLKRFIHWVIAIPHPHKIKPALLNTERQSQCYGQRQQDHRCLLAASSLVTGVMGEHASKSLRQRGLERARYLMSSDFSYSPQCAQSHTYTQAHILHTLIPPSRIHIHACKTKQNFKTKNPF